MQTRAFTTRVTGFDSVDGPEERRLNGRDVHTRPYDASLAESARLDHGARARARRLAPARGPAIFRRVQA